jgi:putative addiction module component (TIGR02574 family)
MSKSTLSPSPQPAVADVRETRSDGNAVEFRIRSMNAACALFSGDGGGVPMTHLPNNLQDLPPSERVALAHALLASVDDQSGSLLAESKRQELLRRAADDDARPDQVIPWEEAKAAILARLGQA